MMIEIKTSFLILILLGEFLLINGIWFFIRTSFLRKVNIRKSKKETIQNSVDRIRKLLNIISSNIEKE